MALALWPTLASAQDATTDTIPFRRHQWAAQFAGGTSFASLGVLRFTAPTRAWLLDFRFTGGYAHACSAFTAPTVSGHSCSNGWTAGAFGELGGAYLITHSFSIGGTATVAFSYERTTQRSSSGAVAKGWAYSGSIQGLSFAATVYF